MEIDQVKEVRDVLDLLARCRSSGKCYCRHHIARADFPQGEVINFEHQKSNRTRQSEWLLF